MKYTIIESSKIVGKTRQTLYRHIESKPITTELGEDGTQYIDASELLRVYGNDINFDAIHDKGNMTQSSNKLQNVTSNSGPVTDSSQIDLRVAQEQLKASQEQISLIQEQAQMQRDQYEARIESMQKSLDKAQDGQNKLTLLLEDQSNKKKSGAGDWEKSIKEVESRVANQEKNETIRKEREAKILRQNKALRNALQQEKEKSFFQKIFG